MRTRILFTLLATFLFVSAAHAQSAMSYKPAATAQTGPMPILPACATAAVTDGDPAKPGSVIMIKIKAGCVIPQHWHSANERLIIVSGSGHAGMKGMSATALSAGDFIFLPAKGIHLFHAVTDVVLYDISDAPFDIHYVDAAGKEIAPAEAFKGY